MEWEFSRAVMQKMDFSAIWNEWIMLCISSVKYLVLMNGHPRENIVPERTLLVSLLNHVKNQSNMMGMRVSRASPPVSHILFVGDNFLSVRVSPVNVMK